MSEIQYLQINSPDVVSETIDGETVIINLYKGLYYNLNPVGSYIWTLIESGLSVDAIAHTLQTHYPHWSETEQASVRDLCDRLLAEELVVATSTPPSTTVPSSATAPATFEAPVLYKYADMQDLLALDPIHDVDETGWPHTPAEVVSAANF
jgi:hypothetical protein